MERGCGTGGRMAADGLTGGWGPAGPRGGGCRGGGGGGGGGGVGGGGGGRGGGGGGGGRAAGLAGGSRPAADDRRTNGRRDGCWTGGAAKRPQVPDSGTIGEIAEKSLVSPKLAV